MSTTLDQQLADAEARYRELAEQAEVQRQAAEQAEAQRQQRRHELEPGFWTEQRRTFSDRHRGTVEQAWQAFRQAILDGQPGTAEWQAYRAAVLWRHHDRHDINRWFTRRAQLAYEERARTARELQATLRRFTIGTGGTEERTAGNMGLTLDEFRQQRHQALTDASAVLGEDVTGLDVIEVLHKLPDYIGRRPLVHGEASAIETDPAPHGARTYAEAVNLVTEEYARHVVEQQRTQRREQREAWLSERL